MTQALRQLVGTDLFADSFGYLNGSDLALQTLFAGPSAPASPVTFQLWADTTTNLLKMRNSANDAWLPLGSLGANFLGLLPLAGGVMSGSIDAGGFPLLNLGLGTGAAAARQQELDAKASIAGPNFTGDATVNQDPVGNNSIPRKSWTEGRYLKLSGGTLTGAVTLSGYGGADYHPAAFKQVKDFVLFNVTTGHRHDGTDARKVRIADLDVTGATDKQVPGFTGGALSMTGLNSVSIQDDPTPQLFSTDDSGASFTTVDLSGSLPGSAIIAVLFVEFDSLLRTDGSARYSELRLRKTGATNFSTYLFDPGSGWPNFSANFHLKSKLQVFVPLDASRRFDYRVIRQGGSAPAGFVTVSLHGYIPSPL